MTFVFFAAMALLISSAALVLYRMTIGPTNLDRIGASDVLITVVIGGIAVATIYTHGEGALPVLLVLSMIGFVGSVSVARFMARRGRR